jgi:TP53 regulating kinase-like protein
MRNSSHPSKEETKLANVYANLGRYAAKLHSSSIIHGDLTTKNVIVSPGKITLIDFGLSFISDRIEDKAEELHLLKQALRSTNDAKRSNEAFKAVIEGYSKVAGKKGSQGILEQITKIERRGRYARVD